MTRILIIDDSAFQRSRVRRATKAAGYELLEAANGHEGLEMIATARPDCILLDLLMPEMGGEEFLEVFRDQGLDIPVIVLTADVQESTRQQCMELGAATFINKPMQETELLDAINRVLDVAAAEKEAANDNDA